jgi:hypothetical protein
MDFELFHSLYDSARQYEAKIENRLMVSVKSQRPCDKKFPSSPNGESD